MVLGLRIVRSLNHQHKEDFLEEEEEGEFCVSGEGEGEEEEEEGELEKRKLRSDFWAILARREHTSLSISPQDSA